MFVDKRHFSTFKSQYKCKTKRKCNRTNPKDLTKKSNKWRFPNVFRTYDRESRPTYPRGRDPPFPLRENTPFKLIKNGSFIFRVIIAFTKQQLYLYVLNQLLIMVWLFDLKNSTPPLKIHGYMGSANLLKKFFSHQTLFTFSRLKWTILRSCIFLSLRLGS